MPSLLTESQLADRLSSLPGWRYDAEAKAIVRQFQFPDFVAAFGFMASVALVAEKMDHHPEFRNVWNTVTLTLWTHTAGGVTDLDLTLASKVDALSPS